VYCTVQYVYRTISYQSFSRAPYLLFKVSNTSPKRVFIRKRFRDSGPEGEGGRNPFRPILPATPKGMLSLSKPAFTPETKSGVQKGKIAEHPNAVPTVGLQARIAMKDSTRR